MAFTTEPRRAALILSCALLTLACGGDADPARDDTHATDPDGETTDAIEVDTSSPEPDVAAEPDSEAHDSGDADVLELEFDATELDATEPDATELDATELDATDSGADVPDTEPDTAPDTSPDVPPDPCADVDACVENDGCCPDGCALEDDRDDCLVPRCGSDEELCAALEVDCELVITDVCGRRRTLDCGTCQDGEACGADGLAGRCGTTTMPGPGESVSLAPHLFGGPITHIFATSKDEVWIGGDYQMLRWRPGRVELQTSPIGRFSRVFATSSDEIWAITIDRNVDDVDYYLVRFDGTSWHKQTTPRDFIDDEQVITAIGGSPGDLWVATGTKTLRFDGVTWTDMGSGSCVRDIFVREPGHPVIATCEGIKRWTGTQWDKTALGRQDRVWVSPTGTVWSLRYDVQQNTISSYSGTVTLRRTEGEESVVVFTDETRDPETSSPTWTRYTLTGSSDGDLWFGAPWDVTYRYDGTAVTLVDFNDDGWDEEDGFPRVSVVDASTTFLATQRALYERSVVNLAMRYSQRLLTYDGQCSLAQPDGAGAALTACGDDLMRVSDTVFERIGTAYAVFDSPTTSRWIQRGNGGIVRGDPAVTVLESAGRSVDRFAGSSDDDMWVLWEDQRITHWDGATWTEVWQGIDNYPYMPLPDIAATSTAAWLKSMSTVWRNDAGVWVKVALPVGRGTAPVKVSSFAAQGDDLWLVVEDVDAGNPNPYSDVVFDLVLWNGSGWTKKLSAYRLITASPSESGLLVGYYDAPFTSNFTVERWTPAGGTPLGTLSSGTYSGSNWIYELAPGDFLVTWGLGGGYPADLSRVRF